MLLSGRFTDQWTSLFTIIVDFSFSICVFTTGEFWSNKFSPVCDSHSVQSYLKLLRIVPYWVRFAQCLRKYRDSPIKTRNHNLVNAGKYFFAISTVAIAAVYDYWRRVNGDIGTATSVTIFIARMLIGTIATLYAYYWDLTQDWALLEPGSKNFLLRNDITFPASFYYGAMIANFLFRVSWAVALFPTTFGITADIHYISLPLASLEVIRRCMWNVFRLEHQHLKDKDQFRIVQDVPVLDRIERIATSSAYNLPGLQDKFSKSKTHSGKIDHNDDEKHSSGSDDNDDTKTSEHKNKQSNSNVRLEAKSNLEMINVNSDNDRNTVKKTPNGVDEERSKVVANNWHTDEDSEHRNNGKQQLQPHIVEMEAEMESKVNDNYNQLVKSTEKYKNKEVKQTIKFQRGHQHQEKENEKQKEKQKDKEKNCGEMGILDRVSQKSREMIPKHFSYYTTSSEGEYTQQNDHESSLSEYGGYGNKKYSNDNDDNDYMVDNEHRTQTTGSSNFERERNEIATKVIMRENFSNDSNLDFVDFVNFEECDDVIVSIEQESPSAESVASDITTPENLDLNRKTIKYPLTEHQQPEEERGQEKYEIKYHRKDERERRTNLRTPALSHGHKYKPSKQTIRPVVYQHRARVSGAIESPRKAIARNGEENDTTTRHHNRSTRAPVRNSHMRHRKRKHSHDHGDHRSRNYHNRKKYHHHGGRHGHKRDQDRHVRGSRRENDEIGDETSGGHVQIKKHVIKTRSIVRVNRERRHLEKEDSGGESISDTGSVSSVTLSSQDRYRTRSQSPSNESYRSNKRNEDRFDDRSTESGSARSNKLDLSVASKLRAQDEQSNTQSKKIEPRVSSRHERAPNDKVVQFRKMSKIASHKRAVQHKAKSKMKKNKDKVASPGGTTANDNSD